MFTPSEWELYEEPQLSEQQRAGLTWRYESLNVLLWALGLVEELIFPNKECDVDHIVSTMIRQTRQELLSKVRLRDKQEILDQLDIAYRLHWAAVDARLHNRQLPDDLHPGIIYERHYALNWLTHYADQEWDDVSTDT
jgi:hypothetical protein